MGIYGNKLEIGKIAETGNLNVVEKKKYCSIILEPHLMQLKQPHLMQLQFNFYPTHCSIPCTQHTAYCRAIEATPQKYRHKYKNVHAFSLKPHLLNLSPQRLHLSYDILNIFDLWDSSFTSKYQKVFIQYLASQ